jgi:hypothetical protein
MSGQGLGDLACNERARNATVQDEPNEIGTEVPRLVKQPQCFARYPALERRRPRRHQRQVECDHGRACQCGRVTRSVDHHPVNVPGGLEAFMVDGVADELDRIE